jgi:hypothetical protein
MLNQIVISLETAIVAKEKGFNEGLCGYYGQFNAIEHDKEAIDGKIWRHKVGALTKNSELIPNEYSAPPQSVLQKWLRDKHNLHIEVKVQDYVEDPSYYWSIFGKYKDGLLIRCLANSGEGNNKLETFFKSYENALEAALKEALNRI